MPITFKYFTFEYLWEFKYETNDEDGNKMFIFAKTEPQFIEELKRFNKFDEYISRDREKTELIPDEKGRTTLF